MYPPLFLQIDQQFLPLAFCVLMILLQVYQAGVLEPAAIPNEAPLGDELSCRNVVMLYCMLQSIQLGYLYMHRKQTKSIWFKVVGLSVGERCNP